MEPLVRTTLNELSTSIDAIFKKLEDFEERLKDVDIFLDRIEERLWDLENEVSE